MTSPEPPEAGSSAQPHVSGGEEPVFETRAARRAALAKGGRGHRPQRDPAEPGTPADQTDASERSPRRRHEPHEGAHTGHRAERHTERHAGRRGERHADGESHHSAVSALRGHAAVPLATILTAVLLAVAGYAGTADSALLDRQLLLAVAVAWAGLVLAWGWPTLLGSPSRVGAPLAIAVAAVGAPGAVWWTSDEPYLTYVPVVLAVALVVMFLGQLLRRDGRGRLIQSLGVTAGGIAVAAIGACYVALGRFDSGVPLLTVALVAVAVGSLAEVLVPLVPLRHWLLPLSMVLGGLGAAATAAVQGEPQTARAVLAGFVVAAVSHALRRVLEPLPAMARLRAKVASGVASVLVSGVVAYAFGWVFLH